jgi:hypothetical protein
VQAAFAGFREHEERINDRYSAPIACLLHMGLLLIMGKRCNRDGVAMVVVVATVMVDWVAESQMHWPVRCELT